MSDRASLFFFRLDPAPPLFLAILRADRADGVDLALVTWRGGDRRNGTQTKRGEGYYRLLRDTRGY